MANKTKVILHKAVAILLFVLCFGLYAEQLDPSGWGQFPSLQPASKQVWKFEKDVFFDSLGDKIDGKGNCLVSDKEYKDGIFRFRVAEQTRWLAQWGIVFRWKDEKNYLEMRFNGQNQSYIEVKNGKRTEKPLPENWLYIPQMRPAEIAIAFNGKQIRVHVDGAERLSFDDNSGIAGRIGFCSVFPASAVKINKSSVSFEGLDSPIKITSIPEVIKKPYIYWNMNGEVRLAWETNIPCSTNLAEAKLENGAGVQAETLSVGQMHYAVFKGLNAGKRYSYVCSSDKIEMGKGSFTSEPGVGKTTRFSLISDSQLVPKEFSRTVDFMSEFKPDFVLHAGDKVHKGLASDWDYELFEPLSPLIGSVPFFSAMGNHERSSKYDNYFLPYPGRAAKTCNYVLRYGCVGVIVADDYEYGSSSKEQLAFLQEALASPEYQKADWKFVVTHKPIYCCGWKEYAGDKWKREEYEALLKKYGVDFYCSGHVHDYERGFKDGTYYIITGGAAAEQDKFARAVRHIAVFRPGLHSCFFEATPEKIELQVKALEKDHEILDRIVIRKGTSRGVIIAPPQLVERIGETQQTLPDVVKVKMDRKVKYRIYYGDAEESYQWSDFYPANTIAELKLNKKIYGDITKIEIDAMDEEGNVSENPLTVETGFK